MEAYSPQCTVNKQGIGAKRGTTRSLQNIGTTRKEEYITAIEKSGFCSKSDENGEAAITSINCQKKSLLSFENN